MEVGMVFRNMKGAAKLEEQRFNKQCEEPHNSKLVHLVNIYL